jgi:hypothetical protein
MSTDAFPITPVDPSLLDRLYTTEEVGQFLRVSQKTVQVWIRAGALIMASATPATPVPGGST